jgi:hypothetical protein
MILRKPFTQAVTQGNVIHGSYIPSLCSSQVPFCLHLQVSFSWKYEGKQNPKGLFGSHHLGLESRNSFVILEITCLAVTELGTEFISNSMIFIPCLILIPMWYPVISVALPNEMISSYHFISFIPNEMK